MLRKKLCYFCQNTIIASDQTWGWHHDGYEDLRSSADDDCTICVQLCEDLREVPHPESLAWPLHRWNIQSPRRSGDTEGVHAAIVLRQAVHLGSDMTSEGEPSVDLPEKTFLLFQSSGTTFQKLVVDSHLHNQILR